MKYFLLMIAMAAFGCSTPFGPVPRKTESVKETKKPLTKEKIIAGHGPKTGVEEIKNLAKSLRDRVIGEYERKRVNGDTIKRVFLENGIRERYTNGKKELLPISLRAGSSQNKWSIVNGEIHAQYAYWMGVYRINPDGSITWIATIKRDGRGDVKRIDFSKENLESLKKISGIGGAIRNWVEVTNISNGMRYFLAIVIVSLMIWYFKRRN